MTVKTDYWSQKLGFPVKEKEAIPVVEKEASNPLVVQYWHDKEGF